MTITLPPTLTATHSLHLERQAIATAKASGVRTWAAQADDIDRVLSALHADPRGGNDIRIGIVRGRAIVRYQDEIHYGATVLDALAQLAQAHCDAVLEGL